MRTLRTSVALLSLSFCATSRSVQGAPFMAGADISSLPVYEENGAVYRDGGTAGSVIPMFRSHGVNWFRLRLFVDPSASNDQFVVQDLPYTVELAQRVKAAGGKVLLDFHYSDTWADPGKQFKPQAWTGLSFAALKTRVHDYTRDTLAAFKTANVVPEMVQIGNEISNGMLWEDGRLWRAGVSEETEFNNLAGLISAGISGAKTGAGPGSEPLIMVHHDKGANWSTSSYYFNRLLPKLAGNGTPVDVLGYSYYPKWHYNPASGSGGVDDLRTALTNAAAAYQLPVVVVETGFASRDHSSEPTYEFPKTAAGQRQFLDAVVDAVNDVPNDRGWGAFWWYPEARPSSGLSVWEGGRYGWFDQSGNLLPAIDAFAELIPPGDYNRDGVVDGGDRHTWSEQFGMAGPTLSADGDGNGRVDGSDFVFWQRRLGLPAAIAAGQPVPEPTMPAMLLTFLAAQRRRRRPPSIMKSPGDAL